MILIGMMLCYTIVVIFLFIQNRTRVDLMNKGYYDVLDMNEVDIDNYLKEEENVVDNYIALNDENKKCFVKMKELINVSREDTRHFYDFDVSSRMKYFMNNNTLYANGDFLEDCNISDDIFQKISDKFFFNSWFLEDKITKDSALFTISLEDLRIAWPSFYHGIEFVNTNQEIFDFLIDEVTKNYES